MKFAILGVTGQVGGATARALIERNEGVRAVIRNPGAAAYWTSRGADIALADFADSDALTRAFRDVDGVFVMTPPQLDAADPFAAGHAVNASLGKALSAAGVRHVVYLSSIGAQNSHGLGAIGKLHDLEQALRALPVQSAAIRAGWFMDNYRSLIESAVQCGTLPSMLDPIDLAVPMIATADIGFVAADLLCGGPNGRRVVELSYPTPYSSSDVARALAKIATQNVRAVLVPGSERQMTYESWGLSSAGAAAMSSMIDGFNSRWITFEGGAAEQRSGATSLETALRSFLPVEAKV